MSSAPRATMMKRQRELDQKDRAKAREQRRTDRRARTAERVASGVVGPPMGEAMAPLGDYDLEAAVQREPQSDPARRDQSRATRLYVGNLSYDTTADALRELFSDFGQVTDVHMVMDRDSGRPRGFAFVTMGTQAEADKAINETNGQMVDGRSLRVNEAEDRPRGTR